MALGILCQQFPRSIQMGVFPNAGKNIQHFASVWLRVLRAIGSEERQTICAREINQFAIDLLLPTNEMPLDFNENIFASKDIDQKPRVILRSACILPNTSFVRQDAERCPLEAGAPEKYYQTLRELQELAPTYCALPFLAVQMRLG